MKSILLPFTVLLLISSCNRTCTNNEQVNASSITVPDDHFTEMFQRKDDGLTGADGTYSVLLPGGKTAWIFGDTFIGGVNPDNTREKQSPIFIRNSLAISDGDLLRTIYQQRNNRNASFVIHPDAQNIEPFHEDSVWFWPGDGFIEENMLKIFLSEFVQIDTGMWDFEWRGTWLATFELPGIIEKEIIPLKQGLEAGVHFGHAVHPEKNHTYVYGAGNGNPHVARFLTGNILGDWEYFDGKNWRSEPSQIKPMDDIQGSEQFSIFRLNDIYIFITQLGGFSTEICSFTSETPYGPWGNKQILYATPIPDSTQNLFTYNAVAHPQFIKDNSLLISYNMNSMKLQDHFDNADIYRPRFIRVPLKKIDPSLADYSQTND